jgi:hypothetical protein
MQFLGKPFFHSHAFGAKQPATKDNIVITPLKRDLFVKVNKKTLNMDFGPSTQQSQKRELQLSAESNKAQKPTYLKLETPVREHNTLLSSSNIGKKLGQQRSPA